MKGIIVIIKRIIFCFLCLLLSVMALGADSITATGFGDTPDEAKTEALRNLSESVFGTSVISGVVLQNSEIDGETRASYSQSVTAVSFGNLVDVKYSSYEKTTGSEEKKLGKYKINAYIDDSAKTIYESKINDSVKSIHQIFRQPATSIEQKKAKLTNLLIAFSDYNTCKQVLIALGRADTVPHLDIEITYMSVFSEYESLLIEEENELLGMRNGTISTVSTQAEIKELLQKNSEEQRRIAADKKSASEFAMAMNLAKINEQIRSTIDKLHSVSFSSGEGDDFTVLLESLRKSVSAYNDVCNSFLSLKREEFARIEAEYSANRKALEEMAYKSAELKADGKTPTDAAAAFRQDQLKDLYDQSELEKKTVENVIIEKLGTEIQKKYDECIKAVKNLNKGHYTIYSNSDGFRLVVGQYDGEKYYWNCSIISSDIEITEICVDYELLTGENPVVYDSQKQNRQEYQQYTNKQSVWDDKLRDSDAVFVLSASFTVSVDAINGRIKLIVDDVGFIDGERTVSIDSFSKMDSWSIFDVIIKDFGLSFLKFDSDYQKSITGFNKDYESQQEANAKAIRRDSIEASIKEFLGSNGRRIVFSSTVDFSLGGAINSPDRTCTAVGVSLDLNGSFFVAPKMYAGVSVLLVFNHFFGAFPDRTNYSFSITRVGLFGDVGILLSRRLALGLKLSIGKDKGMGELYLRWTIKGKKDKSDWVFKRIMLESGLIIGTAPAVLKLYQGVGFVF